MSHTIPTVGQMTKNILAVLNEANEAEIDHGTTWYHTACKRAQEIADEAQLPLDVVVGVIAALSPTNEWEKNLTDARNLCLEFVRGGYMEDVKCSTYNTMKEKAWAILVGVDNIPAHLNGPKITDFYSCIMGDESACVIDGHAWCIANNERRTMQEVPNIGKKARQQMQEAYAAAGKAVGFHAYQIQAITWVAWRRMHGIA